jgi:hypothetical protein
MLLHVGRGELMTRFFINDREIAPRGDTSSLDRIIKSIEDDYLPPRSVVSRIQVDGLPLTIESFPENLPERLRDLENRNKIEIFTSTVDEIAHESISEALQYLDRIEKVTPSVAMSFHFSPGAEAFENLRQLYEGFYWLNLLLDKLKNCFQIALEEVLIQNVSARMHQDKFISILKQLIDSQERKDYVLLSDLLEYEILPLVPVWREMFLIIKKKVNVAQ